MITQLLNEMSALLGFAVSLKQLLIIAALAAGAGMFVAFLRKRKARRRYLQQRKRIVRELLLHAIDQRSMLELAFVSDELQGHVLSGACSSLEDDTLTVDVELKHSLQTWTGERLEVSFKLDYKGAGVHYRFTSQVIGMLDGPRSVSIQLALPLQILPAQKRSYMRIDPLPGHILGMGLWPLDPERPLPQNSAELDCAALIYRPGWTDQCSVLNLSAGGMRVGVSQPLLNRLPANLSLQSQLLCLLLLRSPDSEQPLPFWLVCSIVSLSEHLEEASVIVAVKFKAWALSATGSNDISWFPAARSGAVTPLANWVLRHHLERNRRTE